MYYIYNTINAETRTSWRNAYEVKMAALEHEKRRFQMNEGNALAKPQVTRKGKRHPGLTSIFKASMLLLSMLIK